jgi:hypothetical protein
LELTSFEYPLVSRRSRSSPQRLPRIYIKKENLEHEEEETRRYMLLKFRGASPSTSVAVRLPSLVEELRRSKGQRGMHLH